ncbi:MSCRAMM family protein [Bifidobacterium avesanii]|uniref:Cna protein B-type domain-containing protein n=1 Tax=Bifidobacterium avesanii TaxID=1798157 RepID=A0A7K3TKQ0_9BIFI|nr:SpaA isopeptide-forming pilin-related protein [Bifidobacterium avesanii]NEG79309.1 hypothetical protein [Bifidobacterium avesanii]
MRRWRGPLAALVAVAMGVGTVGYAWAGQPAATPVASASASPSQSVSPESSPAAAETASSASPSATGSAGAADVSDSGAVANAVSPQTPTAQYSISSGAAASAQPENAPAAVAAAGSCDATTWATLKACFADASAAVVTLAAKIAVPASDGDGATIEVAKDRKVTLNAADGAGLTSVGADGAAVTRQASVFHVAEGGELTIAGGSYEKIFATGDGPLAKVEGTLTVTGGTFSGNGTVGGSGGVFRAEAGSTVTFGIENGGDAPEFKGNSAVNGGVIYSRGAVVVKSGLYEGNEATGTVGGQGGGAFHLKESTSTLSIAGGTFRNNESAGEGGGAVYSLRSEKLSVSAGLFEGNMATNAGDNRGGGAVYANATSLSVTGGKFYGNGQDPGDCSVEVGKNPQDACNGGNNGGQSGGGAIYSTGGSLTIQGGVVFKGNYARARDFGSGGGAVWARGEMWIRNSADAQAVKPLFEGNWASIDQPLVKGRKDPTTTLTGPASSISAGGAGGAVFLMNDSTAYITGGSYVNNASGYLGGGIYTEENTTTYVSKAVAYENTAGHFGGGLWFCPSGNSAASKGGNIALFDNEVSDGLDANTENSPDETKYPTEAGADLAIMNPKHKGKPANKFQLMDTWFTDRSEKTVDWYWDGTPDVDASGYQDRWLGGKPDESVKVHDGGSADGNPDGDYAPRYHEGNEGSVPIVIKEPDNHAVTLCLYYTDATKAECAGMYEDGFGYRGVALKAVLTGSPDEQRTAKDTAEHSAQISITGNGARLSGGGFGSNGVVIFDSPYSMEWGKADSTTGKAITETPSTWVLSTTDNDLTDREDHAKKSPYMAPDLRPAQCQAEDQSKLPDDCWRHDKDTGEWSVEILDNGPRDNDNERDKDGNNVYGSIAVDNLAPGKYTLKEKTPPVGYELNETEYKFTIVKAGTDNSLPKTPTLSPATGLVGSDGRTVGDAPISGALNWSKTGLGGAAVAGSEWTIVDSQGKTVQGYDAITDCEVTKASDCTGADSSPAAGSFSVTLDATRFQNGEYTLVETKAPEGYWKPSDAVAKHPFTVSVDNDTKRLTASFTADADKAGVIANAPVSVTWRKTDQTTDALITGSPSSWTLTRSYTDAKGQPATETIDVTDCTSGCPAGNDVNAEAGVITVQGLKPGDYTLEETKAPDGYVASQRTYTFTLGANQEETTITLANAGTDNAIPNIRVVAVLPHTGGLGTARAWLTLGGLFVVAGGVAWAALGARRRRAAMAVAAVSSVAPRSRGRGRHAA